MKAIVFSDTHGNTSLIGEAVRRIRPDLIIHLGDHDRDAVAIREEFPGTPLYMVCGNCDISPLAPERDIVPLGPVKALILHGHQYAVKYGGLDPLVYAAEEAGAKIVMFGHTHEPLYEERGGVVLLNPGTAGRGRTQTFAVAEVSDNGGILCSIREL